ncbi:MAG TPA: 1,4-alpha-glucan branching protein GlgB, partial [Tepidiformaceae bacterium]|nr:1,4-alpha-glucan branching protein GlgB [Tepidiformaceae bacterium]
MTTLDAAATERLLAGTLHDPHSILGMHPTAGGVSVRVFAPAAQSVSLIERGRDERVPLAKTTTPGLFAANLASRATPFPYVLEMKAGAQTWTQGDPYRFLPTLGDQDLHFIGEGTHRRMYERLGAHPRTMDGEKGVAFAVWAPSARGVSVIGDFNAWHRRSHPMRALGASGIWELFIPGLARGEHYKFNVIGVDGVEREKADPVAFYAEKRPRTASIVAGLGDYRWGDDEWMARRRLAEHLREPMSAYELHLGSWRTHADGSWLTYRELAAELVPYLSDLGYTHVELLPVAEHPYDGSWGYQVTGFYAPTSRFGTPDDFRYLVDQLHQAGIGVLMDWVPAHFATDAHCLEQFDGTYLYEHHDPGKRVQPDWGTYTFNYGRHEVRNFLLANAMYWLREFHIDGLRVDAVSSMLYLDYSREHGEWQPNIFGGRENLEAIDFLKQFNELVYDEGEGAITIAEESTAWPAVSRPTYSGGLGFGLKWNMGWMHDTLLYFSRDPIHRKFHQGTLTFSMMYAYSENFVLSLSHDEVVHGKASLLHKMPGDEWQQFANLRLLFAYQHAQPGKKLIFMGSEWGQRSEWSHEHGLEWHALEYPRHRQVQELARELNAFHVAEPALHRNDHEPSGFSWLDFSDADNSVIAFARHGDEPADDIVCVFNLTPVPRYHYRIPSPAAGRYREILNTDSARFGGSGVETGAVTADPIEHGG